MGLCVTCLKQDVYSLLEAQEEINRHCHGLPLLVRESEERAVLRGQSWCFNPAAPDKRVLSGYSRAAFSAAVKSINDCHAHALVGLPVGSLSAREIDERRALARRAVAARIETMNRSLKQGGLPYRWGMIEGREKTTLVVPGTTMKTQETTVFIDFHGGKRRKKGSRHGSRGSSGSSTGSTAYAAAYGAAAAPSPAASSTGGAVGSDASPASSVHADGGDHGAVKFSLGLGRDVAEQLDHVARLHDCGVLSQKEYEAAKKQVLAWSPHLTAGTSSSPYGLAAETASFGGTSGINSAVPSEVGDSESDYLGDLSSRAATPVSVGAGGGGGGGGGGEAVAAAAGHGRIGAAANNNRATVVLQRAPGDSWGLRLGPGAVVQSVGPGSPADAAAAREAGLCPGCRVARINGEVMVDVEQCIAMLTAKEMLEATMVVELPSAAAAAAAAAAAEAAAEAEAAGDGPG
eukprot:g1835.t1